MVRRRQVPWLVVACLVACAGGVSAEGPLGPVTGAVPWPYGLILYVDVPPEQTASAVAAATWAVESVCRFWEIQSPVIPEGWEKSLARAGCSYVEGMHPMLTSLILPRHAVRLPGPQESILRWWRCPYAWGERWPLEPVILAVLPDVEAVSRLSGNRPFRAFFSSFGLYTDRYPSRILGPVIVMTQEDLLTEPGILCQEVTHWLFSDTLNVELPGSRLRILREGSARLAEERILGMDSYRAIAAIFAETGRLSDIPLSLLYPIGASVAEVLLGADMEQVWATHDAEEGIWRLTDVAGLSKESSHWRWLAYVVEDRWRESLEDVELSARDRVIYAAASVRLGMVAWMLDPVLSDEARAYADRLCTGDVPDPRIELFWELLSEAPAHLVPSQIERLAIREDALAQIALDNAIYEAPPRPEGESADTEFAQYLIARLVGLRQMEAWCLYYEEFVRLVRLYVAEGAVEPDLIPWWNPDPAPPADD